MDLSCCCYNNTQSSSVSPSPSESTVSIITPSLFDRNQCDDCIKIDGNIDNLPSVVLTCPPPSSICLFHSISFGEPLDTCKFHIFMLHTIYIY